MFQIHFSDYGNTSTTYCYISLIGRDLINRLHVATLCMTFSPINNKLLTMHIPKHRLAKYPELHEAIPGTLYPLLKKAHKNDVENIINTFMLIYADVT